jgi:uncharacterized membrane protein
MRTIGGRGLAIGIVVVCLIVAPVGQAIPVAAQPSAETKALGIQTPTFSSQTAPTSSSPVASLNGPDPSMQVAAPDEVTKGESFTIRVDSENRGDTAGEFSTISLSAPTLDTASRASELTDVQTTLSYKSIIDPGETLYTKDGDSTAASYTLIEAGTSGGGTWEAGASHDLTVEVTPSETGTYVFYVRTTFTEPGNTESKVTDPAYGDAEDQQGYEVRRVTVDVTDGSDGGDNDPPVIEDAAPDGPVTTDIGEWSDLFEVDASDPDGDGDDLTYTWKWWEDDELLNSWEGDDDRQFKWDEPGEYRIQVVVSDGEDTDSHSWTFVIEEATTTYGFDLKTDGSGTVAISPSGVTSDQYETEFEDGTDIELTARPAEGYEFTGWDGDIGTVDRDDRSIELEMDQARSVTATFERTENDRPVIEEASPDGPVKTGTDEWSDYFAVDASDPDGDDDDLTYTWKWWEDDELLNSWEDDDDMRFKWDEPGEYRIQVVVSDGEDTDSHSWTFVIEDPSNGTPADRFGVANPAFEATEYHAGEQATGTVDIVQRDGSDRQLHLEIAAIGPDGEAYAVDLPEGDEVWVEEDTSETVAVSLEVVDGMPTGPYDLRIQAWPTDVARTEENRLFTRTSETVLRVVDGRADRGSVDAGEVSRATYLPGETVSSTVMVENTGTVEREFTVRTVLRRPDGTLVASTERSTTVVLLAGRERDVEFSHRLPDSASSGDYDVVTTVMQDGMEVATDTNEEAFEVVAGETQAVTIPYLGGHFEATAGESITPVVGVSTGSDARELAVTYVLRGPDGSRAVEETQRVSMDAFGHEQLKPSLRITEADPNGEYDLVVTITPAGGDDEQLARRVKDDIVEVTGNSDGSIMVTQESLSTYVELHRDGTRLDSKYLNDGNPVTFDGLADGTYTVEYTLYHVGDSDTVTRTVEVEDGADRTLELKPGEASATGYVEIDSTRVPYATIEIDGERVETDGDGNFQFGPSLSTGYHDLSVTYDGRVIYEDRVEIDPGENSLAIGIDYVDPNPNDEFDGAEAMLGFWCGELCYADSENGHANAEYMLGWMLSGVNPAFDIRDGLGSAAKGDTVGVGLSLIGLVPYYGDVSSISGRLPRVLPKLPVEETYQLREMIRRSSIDKKDAILTKMNKFSPADETLKSTYGLSGDFTKRLDDTQARKLRHIADRLKATGYEKDEVAQFIRRHGGGGSTKKVEEFSHAAEQFKDATGSIPKDHSEMLEALWFNRIRKAEGASVAKKTTEGGTLTEGSTYIATGVEVPNGELDTVVFTVDDGGNPTVLKAFEVTKGKRSNKPPNQLEKNLAAGSRYGSDSHHYLDAEAFSARPTDAQHKGYVGFENDMDLKLQSERAPTGTEQLYTKDEFLEMSSDLGHKRNADGTQGLLPAGWDDLDLPTVWRGF